MNTEQFVLDFIPIILIYLFVTYPKDSILFSDSSLGRFIAICIIVFYTSVNSLYGVFVCLLILVYYQTDFVEEILNMERGVYIEQHLHQLNQELIGMNMRREGFVQNMAAFSEQWFPSKQETPVLVLDKPINAFTPGTPDLRQYKSEQAVNRPNSDRRAELNEIFRKSHCVNGQLEHRGMPVKPEMADHVFREIQFYSEYQKCDPCNPGCKFSIIESKLETEQELQRPTSSNDVFNTNIESIQQLLGNTVSLYMPKMDGFPFFRA